MNQFLPHPEIKPFERLKARDGLLINAERWRKVQEYHSQRQNFHYQSLHQPGIVCGLAVKIVSSESKEPIKYRDGKSVQIQPGIAIDLKGNPIIIEMPENIQISLEPPKDNPLLIYLVVSYRDPDELAIQAQGDLIKEQFRIDFKVIPPNELEVEVCRILIPPNQPIRLTKSLDVFAPNYHNLDFRFRQLAAIRHQEVVRIAQIKHKHSDNNLNFINLDYLLKATPGLYPQLKGLEPVGLISLNTQEIEEYDLLYLTGEEFEITSLELKNLKQYLEKGGVILVEAVHKKSQFFQDFTNLIKNQLNISLNPLSKRHYLRRHPFLFAALPFNSEQQPIEIFTEGGIILATGNLASLWGLDEQLSLSRNTIREAQELGINILNYAWKRRQMNQLQFSGIKE